MNLTFYKPSKQFKAQINVGNLFTVDTKYV